MDRLLRTSQTGAGETVTTQTTAPQQQLHAADRVIEVYKRGVDRTLVRQNLGLSVEERLLRFMDLQRFAQELHSAGQQALMKS